MKPLHTGGAHTPLTPSFTPRIHTLRSHPVCTPCTAKVMLFILSKLSTRFNQLSALQYGVASPRETSTMRHKYWFGLTLESGPGVHVTKLRVILMREAELKQIPPVWTDTDGRGSCERDAEGSPLDGNVSFFRGMLAAEEAALTKLKESALTRSLRATDARSTPHVAKLREQYSLPVPLLAAIEATSSAGGALVLRLLTCLCCRWVMRWDGRW
jgi:hypothetical protein